MKRLRDMFALAVALCVVSLTGLWAQDQTEANSSDEKPVESKISDEQRKNLEAELDRAIQLLKAGDQPTFIEDYIPVDSLRQIRVAKADLKEIGPQMRANQSSLNAMITLLQQARAGQFVGNDDEVAIHPQQIMDEGQPEPIAVAQPLRNIKDIKGYGDDFPKALSAGLADLKAKKFEEFIRSMLPASEVGRLSQSDQIKMTASIFTLYPELATAMIADLEAISKLDPQAEAGLLKVMLEGPGGEKEIRFQLSDGHWRFFDQALEMDDSVRPLLESQPKIESIVEPILTMERIRDHWRIKNWPNN